MLTGPENITLFLGNFGSGKTEAAVNFAIYLAEKNLKDSVTIIDLDIVNPYFRSREARKHLEKHGVRVILPDTMYLYSELPILVPEVRSAIMASTSYIVLDVGGDDVGARVLGALHDALSDTRYRALMVLNAFRPFTNNCEGIIKIMKEIEFAGKISITGFVSNTHLIEETTTGTVLSGYKLAKDTEEATGIRLEFVCVPENLVDDVTGRVNEDVLPIFRYLAPEWSARENGNGRSGKDLFRL